MHRILGKAATGIRRAVGKKEMRMRIEESEFLPSAAVVAAHMNAGKVSLSRSEIAWDMGIERRHCRSNAKQGV